MVSSVPSLSYLSVVIGYRPKLNSLLTVFFILCFCPSCYCDSVSLALFLSVSLSSFFIVFLVGWPIMLLLCRRSELRKFPWSGVPVSSRTRQHHGHCSSERLRACEPARAVSELSMAEISSCRSNHEYTCGRYPFKFL